MLIPLIFAIWIIPEDEEVSIFFQISNQLKWALMGLVAALVIIGILIIRFVPGDKTYHEKKGLAASLHQELEIKLSLLAVHSYRYHD